MSLRRFIFPCYDDDNGAYSLLLLVVRIFFGIMFLTHGYDKLMAHATMADLFANPIGLGSAISFWMVVFAELVCSLALIFGILQRVALIPMIISMAVAFFMVHGVLLLRPRNCRLSILWCLYSSLSLVLVDIPSML